MTSIAAWNAADHNSWANTLGLVHTPLFAPGCGPEWARDASALMDGRMGSMCLFDNVDKGGSATADSLSYTWSADYSNTIHIDTRDRSASLHQWGIDDVRPWPLPQTAAELTDLFNAIADAPRPRTPDVVVYVLRAFRRLRATLQGLDDSESIRVFNGLLERAAVVRESGDARIRAWAVSRTIGDAIGDFENTIISPDDIAPAILKAPVGTLLDTFVERDAETGLALHPGLLLRHASGRMYQEAHMVIAPPPQLTLHGMGESAPRGELMRDVRFTPPPLARMLVQESLDALPDLMTRQRISILDPACGSGVFLIEALRELMQRGFQGEISLSGFDITQMSCDIAQFCLAYVLKEYSRPAGASINIRCCDALREGAWAADVILMNPPFAAWRLMSADDKLSVTETLGDLKQRNPDKAMAFVWKAIKCACEGAVVTSVLPSPLFEIQGGQKWREAILDQSALQLIGKFRGYSYFSNSLVEPGFIVSRRHRSGVAPRSDVTMVVAGEGREEAAIRQLRIGQYPVVGSERDQIDIYALPESEIGDVWAPIPYAGRELIDDQRAKGTPHVDDLFCLQEGVHTGCNEAFILKKDEYEDLPEVEQSYFRPCAGKGNIHYGTLSRDEYLWFPYGPQGMLLETESDVKDAVKAYWELRLRGMEPKLRQLAAKRGARFWWGLEREREWQWQDARKLVSEPFGRRGGFAFDKDGDFRVVQGNRWQWADRLGSVSPAQFLRSLLPWAYLALLNSTVFETMLAVECPQLQGGQYNLSKKFASRVFLPDLSDQSRVSRELVDALAEIGKSIQDGLSVDYDFLNRLVGRSYGL